MSRGTLRASLTIYRQPDLTPDAKRFEVDCRYSTTGLTIVPSPAIGWTDEALITAAAFAHAEKCGSCDLGEVFARGDQQARDLTERLWSKIQGALLMQARRN